MNDKDRYKPLFYSLTQREERLLEGRYCSPIREYEEIAKWFNLPPNRIRHMEAAALNKLGRRIAESYYGAMSFSHLDRSIHELELSVRITNCLKHMGVETIRDLVMVSPKELLKQPGMGRKAVKGLIDILHYMNLNLRQDT